MQNPGSPIDVYLSTLARATASGRWRSTASAGRSRASPEKRPTPAGRGRSRRSRCRKRETLGLPSARGTRWAIMTAKTGRGGGKGPVNLGVRVLGNARVCGLLTLLHYPVFFFLIVSSRSRRPDKRLLRNAHRARAYIPSILGWDFKTPTYPGPLSHKVHISNRREIDNRE